MKLVKLGSSSTIELPVLKKLLELMRCDAVGIISKVPFTDEVAGGPMYMVDMNAIISTIKQKTIHSIVSEKLGMPSARILELLMRKKYLDQTQVGEWAILPIRESRERIYQLFKFKYIDYVEVSKRLDFTPSTSSYLWYVDVVKLYRTLLESMYHGMLSLSVRRNHEFSLGKELLDFAHQLSNNINNNSNNMNNSNPCSNLATESEKFEKLSNALDRMDRAKLKLAETIMLLNNL